MRLWHLTALILAFAGTLCSAQGSTLSLGFEHSSSQVRVSGSKYSGDLSGLKLSGRMGLAQRYAVHFDYTTGSGAVTAGDTKDASYTRNTQSMSAMGSDRQAKARMIVRILTLLV